MLPAKWCRSVRFTRFYWKQATGQIQASYRSARYVYQQFRDRRPLFNFSTTGQWLWDELQVVLPAGHDPYPMVDAIHKKVTEATQQSTEQAEEESRDASNSPEMSDFSANLRSA